MTVSTTQIRVSYVGDGTSTVFTVPWLFYAATDLTVMLGYAPQASGYSVMGMGAGSGTVTFASAPAVGVAVQIILTVPLTQTTALVDGTAFPSATLNQINDRAIQADLRLNDLLSRALVAPDGDVSPLMALPPAAQRANTVQGYDSLGNSSLLQSIPSGTLSRASIGGLLFPQTAQENSLGINPVDYGYPTGTVDRYAVNVTPGTTNMLAAVAAAFLVAKQGGGNVTFLQGASYNLGNVTADGKAAPLLSVVGLSDTVVYGNGATIITNTTAFVVGAVIGITNPNNVAFYDLNFIDTGFDQSQVGLPNFKCAHSIFVTSTGSSNYSGVTLVNCQASNTGSLFGTWLNSIASRITNINLIGCRALNCFYGTNFQQQGDDVTILGMYVLNPCRAYFPYGVSGHNVDISVRNDGTNANAGANALCDIKRYDFDTKEIKLRLTYHGLSSIYGALVNLEANVTSNAPALFDGIDIDLRLADSTVTGSSVGFPVQFSDVSTGSTVNPTATQWKRISIRGDVGAWPLSNINNPINIASVPNVTRGQIAFAPEFFDVTVPTPQIFPGFAVKTKPNTSVHTMQGDLTAANTGACDARTIDLTSYNGALFVLRVTVYAEANYTTGSTQQCYRRYLIFGHNTSNTVVIQSTNVEATYDAGSASSVTVSATGNYIQFAFTVYNGANAQLRIETEHLSKFT